MLLRIGGKVPGQNIPKWRVCIAEHCIRKSAGVLHHLPTGEVSVFDVDGEGKVHGKTSIGDRVESGTFELTRYPVKGWIIERWFPPAAWGTPEEWASHRAEDGGRIMASEFPHKGDYFITNGPFEEIPDLGDLENAIRMWEHGYDNRPTNILAHYKSLLQAEEDLREQRMEKLVKDLEYMRQNELVPVLKSGSLEAQSVRNDLQRMIGDTSHLGVVINP
jgi:hypothetical protein